jgi:hypothetical protein
MFAIAEILAGLLRAIRKAHDRKNAKRVKVDFVT